MMNLEGIIFHRKESELANVTVTDGPDMANVSITIAGTEIIKFPLTLNLDADLISSKIGNVINQTGLIDYPVTVVLEPL